MRVKPGLMAISALGYCALFAYYADAGLPSSVTTVLAVLYGFCAALLLIHVTLIKEV